jgi:hypothetical protein
MATGRSKAAPHNPNVDRLPDRMLVDIGLDAGAYRRRSWSEYLQHLTRHIGPTRS